MAPIAQRYVAYLRVSTDRQGKSGLGLEAQRLAVAQYVMAKSGEIVSAEYVEVESGKRNDRPELEKALKHCRLTGAILIVAKLDRLSRNAAFLMTLRDSGVEFVAADLPEANTMTVGIMALVAQHEREAISARTKAALAASRARGKKLGGYRVGAPDISQFQDRGVEAARTKANARAEELREFISSLGADMSLNKIAAELNRAGVLTSRGATSNWTPTSVSRLLRRLNQTAPRPNDLF